MYGWTDDPVRDAERYDAYLEERSCRHRRGRCLHCNEDVHDYDDHYDIDGDMIHADCLYDWAQQYRRNA